MKINKPKKFFLKTPEQWINGVLDDLTKVELGYGKYYYLGLKNNGQLFIEYSGWNKGIVIKMRSGISEKLLEDYKLTHFKIKVLLKKIFKKRYNLKVDLVDIKKIKLINGKKTKINETR